MVGYHVAVFTGLGDGHVNPALGVCMELINRGYRVTYATDERYSSRIGSSGVEPLVFKQIDPLVSDETKRISLLPCDNAEWWEMYGAVVYPWYVRNAETTLMQVERFYIENPPHVILYDRLSFAGRILAKRLRCAAIQISFEMAYYKKYLHRQNGASWNPAPIERFSRDLDLFFSRHGFEEKDNLWHIEKLNIYCTSKSFQHNAEWFDDRFCFVGPCLNRPYRPIWTDKSDGKPIVLISGLSDGIDSDYFKPFVDAFSGTDYHVILSIGNRIPGEALGTLPENFEINRFAQHLEILPRTVLSICHAGMGTTLESLYHGVPIIAVPPTPFNEEIGYRIAELGLGILLERTTLTSEVLKHGVKTVLEDHGLLRRVKEMQKAVRSSGGAALAVDKLEEFLGVHLYTHDV